METGVYVPEDGLPRSVARGRSGFVARPSKRSAVSAPSAATATSQGPHGCPSLPLTRGELRQLARQLLHLL
eukprot:scaffold83282_cov45-Phaeocystis_antarctica.AAC.1